MSRRRKKRGKRQKIELNKAWYLFYGYQIGLSRQETLTTIYGEFMDLISCLSIYNGADQKKKKIDFDEVINLR